MRARRLASRMPSSWSNSQLRSWRAIRRRCRRLASRAIRITSYNVCYTKVLRPTAQGIVAAFLGVLFLALIVEVFHKTLAVAAITAALLVISIV